MKKNQPGPDNHATPPESNSLFAQLVRLVTRIAIKVADLLRDIRHPLMDDVTRQDSHLTWNYDVGMHFAFDPAAAVASEKSGLIIRIDPGVAHPTTQDMILARQAKRLHAISGRR